MAIKESSDELNPPVVTSGVSIAPARGARSSKDYLALAIATCGVGYLPIAPGTWGSAVGVGIYLLLHEAIVQWLFSTGEIKLKIFTDVPFLILTVLLLAVIAILSFAGTWAATRVERIYGRKDPGKVVVDEVAGQLITFLFIPFVSPWWVIAIGFFLFRAFDIWKPYPIRRLEALESGLGIMADDVLAGIYAAIVLSVIALIYVLK
jgi:phosphatidylglycerophosphatase A